MLRISAAFSCIFLASAVFVFFKEWILKTITMSIKFQVVLDSKQIVGKSWTRIHVSTQSVSVQNVVELLLRAQISGKNFQLGAEFWFRSDSPRRNPLLSQTGQLLAGGNPLGRLAEGLHASRNAKCPGKISYLNYSWEKLCYINLKKIWSSMWSYFFNVIVYCVIFFF